MAQMSERQWKRWDVIGRVNAERLTMVEAAGICGIRERRAQAGLMLLWDGSPHRWLEDRGPRLCLMAAMDDATSELLPGAHFVEQECVAGYLRVLKAIASHHGLPWSIYMDQHGSLKVNDNC